MSTRNLVTGAAAAAMMIWTAGCMSDNSVGGGTGGTAAPGTGGATTPAGTGGAPSAGTGGGTAAVGTGGSAPSGTGGVVATGGGAGGRAPAGTGGAAGPSGGSTGTGTGTAGAGGPSLCPVAGTTLCDGFEAAAPGAAGSDFMIDVAAGDTMTVDTTKAYRGTKSMKFSGTTRTYITETKTFSGTTKATNNNFWGRYFILSGLTGTPPASHAVYGTLSGTGTTGDGEFHFVGGSRAKLQAEIRNTSDSYTDSMSAPAAADPGFPLPADGWQCWEFHVQPDDSYAFYINSVEVMEMRITAGKAVKSGSTFSPLPIMNKLSIGWQYFGTALNSGWIDEVAVGPDRIGCGN